MQKRVDCLSRAPLPLAPTDAPMQLDEFPNRVALTVQALGAVPDPLKSDAPSDSLANSKDHQLYLVCSLAAGRIQATATKAHTLSRLAKRSTDTPRAFLPTRICSLETDAEDFSMSFTDVEDEPPGSPTIERVLVSEPVPDCGRDIPLLHPAEDGDLRLAQTTDPEWVRYWKLMGKPREDWPPALAASSLEFTEEQGVLCAKLRGADPKLVLPQSFANVPFTHTTSIITPDTLEWPRHARLVARC